MNSKGSVRSLFNNIQKKWNFQSKGVKKIKSNNDKNEKILWRPSLEQIYDNTELLNSFII